MGSGAGSVCCRLQHVGLDAGDRGGFRRMSSECPAVWRGVVRLVSSAEFETRLPCPAIIERSRSHERALSLSKLPLT
jgi:hypothetical protein